MTTDTSLVKLFDEAYGFSSRVIRESSKQRQHVRINLGCWETAHLPLP